MLLSLPNVCNLRDYQAALSLKLSSQLAAQRTTVAPSADLLLRLLQIHDGHRRYFYPRNWQQRQAG
jgi:hypothetical protein